MPPAQLLDQGDLQEIHPPEPEKDYIKRIIGVEGDKIMIKDGQVYLNGLLFDQSSFLKSSVKTFPGAFMAEGEEVTVPENHFFVMGDNRGASSDSREWGFVSRDELIGESLFVYLPLTRMRLIENPFKN
jgi:signal peptidase I